jgi:hypothetical protein
MSRTLHAASVEAASLMTSHRRDARPRDETNARRNGESQRDSGDIDDGGVPGRDVAAG